MSIFKKIKNLNRKFFLVIVVILCILGNFISLISPSIRNKVFGLGVPSKLVNYTSTTQQFSILHPSSWTIYETPQGNSRDKEVFATISNGGFGFGNVTLARKQFSDGSVDEVAKWGEERAQIPYTTGYLVISESTHTVNNNTGFLRTYTYNGTTLLGKYTNECEDWYFIKNAIGYDVSFCADQRDWNKVEDTYLQMINSFTVN
jgi:hypothetical protein